MNYSIELGYIDGENKSAITKADLMKFPTIYSIILANDEKNENVSDSISLNNFVKILKIDGWVGLHDDNAITEEMSKYRLYSKKYNAQFIISISNEEKFKKNSAIYIDEGIRILNEMTGNNIANIHDSSKSSDTSTNIQQSKSNFQPELVVDNRFKSKVKVYINSVKKLFKERPKLAIALCTLTAITTVAAGGFIVKTVVDRVETQRYLDSHKRVEQQTTAPPEYNINEFIDETRKQYEMNTYVNAQNQQLNDTQMEQNNQRIR